MTLSDAPHVQLKYLVRPIAARIEESGPAVPYIGLEDIESHTGNLFDRSANAQRYSSSSVSEPRYGTRFLSGDVLFGKLRPYLGKAWVAEFDGMCTTEALVLRPHSVEPRFLRYFLLSSPVLDSINAAAFGSRMPRADWQFIGRLPVPLSTPSQQSQVADHLDRVTAPLDSLIAEQQHLLKLLDERHRVLITGTVIRGVDSSASLCDSGISWMGAIPAHWKLLKLGHISSVGNGSTPNRGKAEYWTDTGVPWLNSAVVNHDEVVEADQFITPLALRECHLPLVRKGSVLVAMTGQGKTRGKAVVLSIEATINQHLTYISPDRSCLDPWFLRWSLFAAYNYLRSISDDTGGTKGALTCEDIAHIRIPIPPMSEQQIIVAYIASQSVSLKELRGAAEQLIGLLKERRSSLIRAAVVGHVHLEGAA